MTYTHCRGCGVLLHPMPPDTADGLCTNQDPNIDCFHACAEYGWATRPASLMLRFESNYADPEWSAIVDEWLEKGKPRKPV